MNFELILMSFSVIHRQMAHLIHSRGFRHCNSRLSWFLICSRWRWGKKKRVWWKVLGSDGWRHTAKVYQTWNMKMGMCGKTDHLESRICSNPTQRLKVLLLFITFSNDMERHEIDHLECEANAMASASSVCSSQLSFRNSNSQKLVKLMNREALDQLEAWQNLWAFPLWYEAAYRPSHER